MALARRSGSRIVSMIWPGFVDAMTALLLILMFVMSIFMIIQFTMSQKISGQSKELDDLTRQLVGLADVLSLERDRSTALEGEVGELQSNLASQRSEADRLNAAMAALVQARGLRRVLASLPFLALAAGLFSWQGIWLAVTCMGAAVSLDGRSSRPEKAAAISFLAFEIYDVPDESSAISRSRRPHSGRRRDSLVSRRS